jgi:hypothetical protein
LDKSATIKVARYLKHSVNCSIVNVNSFPKADFNGFVFITPANVATYSIAQAGRQLQLQFPHELDFEMYAFSAIISVKLLSEMTYTCRHVSSLKIVDGFRRNVVSKCAHTHTHTHARARARTLSGEVNLFHQPTLYTNPI